MVLLSKADKHKINYQLEEQTMDLNFYLEKLKDDVTVPMLEYMREAGIDDYTEADVARCGQLLTEYLTALAELTEPEDAAIVSQVEQVVLALNELNEELDYALIETVERESIAELIQTAAVDAGLQDVPDDVTEDWREW